MYRWVSWVFLLWVSGTSNPVFADEAWPDPLPVCDDAAEWPPFTYYARDRGGSPTQEVTGYSVDVLTRILAPLKLRARIELLPWARCLNEVAHGEGFVLALNASPSPERSERFLVSHSYYNTHHTYFYSKKFFPKGLRIDALADLGRYRVCGVHGYNYSAYGITTALLDTGAMDLRQVIAKLHAGRCEIGIEKLEVLVGSRITGQDLLADKNLGLGAVPELPPGDFHMLVSRRFPELASTINQGIARLAARGELARIHARYFSKRKAVGTSKGSQP